MFMILNLRNHYQLSIVLEFLFFNLHIIMQLYCKPWNKVLLYFTSSSINSLLNLDNVK